MTDHHPPPQQPPGRPPRPSAMTTLASRASATLVALIAGYSSYTHIAHVALRHGERPDVAYLLPFAIDGLLIVATTAMLDDKRHHRHIRTSARLAFTFGVTASLAANIASAQPTTTARIVAAIPAITLLLAIEVISRTGHPHHPASNTTPDSSNMAAATNSHPRPDTDIAATTPATPASRRGQHTTPTRANTEQTTTHHNGHRVPTPPDTGHRPPSTATTRRTHPVTTQARVAALLATNPDLTTAILATQPGGGSGRAWPRTLTPSLLGGGVGHAGSCRHRHPVARRRAAPPGYWASATCRCLP